MAKKYQKKDDLSAISKSFKKEKPAKDLEVIKKVARKTSTSPTAKNKPAGKAAHRTTINLPIETYKTAKKHCVDIGKTLTDYISGLIEQDLGKKRS